MLLYQLGRPVSYLIIQDHSKWKIDWLVPFIITALICLVYYFVPQSRPLYGKDNLMGDFAALLQILPGFYLAALAAVATFNKNDLDFHLPSPTPKIEVRINNHDVPILLTRRRMLCYLFGYLTFLSLALYLLIIFGSAIAPSFHYPYISQSAEKLFGVLAFAIFNLFFWQMITVTCFGLYQLCDRIHQPDNNE